MKKNQFNSGFSLVELLIVIAIIGILATIAIPLMLSARQDALDEKARQSVRIVLSAEQAYHAQQGVYGSLAALANSNPPFIDSRFSSGTGNLGNGLVITLVLNGGGSGFTVTADNPGGTNNYSATESMSITSTPH